MTVPPPVHNDTMTEEEEPSVLISAKALQVLVDATIDYFPDDEFDEAMEEALSALERYK